jgi:hypothetical protein
MSASDENCEGTYGWCDFDHPFPKWTVWEWSQPNNGNYPAEQPENCITLEYDMGINFLVFFGDRNCNNTGGIKFICEVRTSKNVQLYCNNFIYSLQSPHNNTLAH